MATFGQSASSGAILQIQSCVKSDTQTYTSTSFGTLAGTDQNGSGSAWCVKITPSATSSKVLVTIDIHASCSADNNKSSMFGMFRDSTNIYGGTIPGNQSKGFAEVRHETNTATYYYLEGYHATFLDSPNSTSELTYSCQAACHYNSPTLYINASGYDIADTPNIARNVRAASTITVMEIAG
tara:strand:+ start:221 stop:766 length:546 start_codon:yes stop_codon:yes gene_type:complete